MKYTIDKETLDEIFKVLSQLPYNQVAVLINQMQQKIKPLEDNNEADKE